MDVADQDCDGIRALPQEARRYIARLEQTSGVSCAIISTGSDRGDDRAARIDRRAVARQRGDRGPITGPHSFPSLPIFYLLIPDP
jgi:hypothetical protein